MLGYITRKEFLIVLFLFSLSAVVLSNQSSHPDLESDSDSLKVLIESFQVEYLKSDFDKKTYPSIVRMFVSTLHSKSGKLFTKMDYRGYGSEVVEVTTQLYKNYYKQKIMLYNYNNRGYLYISLKDAQNRRGFLQIHIPLGNLSDNKIRVRRKH